MLLFFFFFIIIAQSVTRSVSRYHRYSQRKLWIVTFGCYIIFTLISHLYVSNPSTTFFISSDQMYFYDEAILLSEYDFADLFSVGFLNFEYSEASFAFMLFAVLVKVARYLGVADILLFLKFHVAFLASLIPVIIYKIVVLKRDDIPNLYERILVFALVSPLLIYSCQLLRDIHVCLLFTIMFYVALRPKQSYRYLLLLLLAVITFCFRMENGLFSVAIIFIPIYRTFCTGGIGKKSVIIATGLVFCVLALIPILEVMDDTLMRYAERSSDAASVSSLGDKLNLLPTPLGAFAKAGFSQLLPFPVWLYMLSGENYAWLRIVEVLFPFYWIPIWMSLIYGWWNYRSLWDRDLLMIFYVSILYITLNSIGELNVRRIMAVYPVLLVCFLLLKQQFNLPKLQMNKLSYCMIFLFHLIYIVIKI